MPKKTVKMDAMGMVRKELPKKKPVIAPKREVFGSDLVKTPRPVKAAKANGQKQAPKPTGPVKKVSIAYKVSASTIIPILIMMLGLASVLKAVEYLPAARNSGGTILGMATSAYDDLNAANESLNSQDFVGAKDRFASAQHSLANAQSELGKFRLLALLAPPAKSADDIMTGAFFLAEAGKNLTSAMQLFDELSVNSGGIATDNFADKLEQNHTLLKNSLLLLSYAQEKFDAADSLPGEYQEKVRAAREQVSMLSSVLTELVNLEDLFLSFFGKQPRTYLLVFQNYDEMRATGGFIGTYGVLKYENGAIKKLKIESIYNLDGSLTKQIAAPGPFQPEIAKWALRDSNWFADFPTSAKKMLEFFEMEAETADGILSITPQLFENILTLVGPIDMPDYDVTLTPENFQDVVQQKTSHDYDKKLNQPKKFLDDFAPVMLDKLANLKKEQWFQMFELIQNNFLQKHILVYSKDAATQAKIHALGYDGRIKDTDHDYLSVINSNHGGTKTDLDVEQSISYSSSVGSDGKVNNTVRITRSNPAKETNTSFMRVLVPQGSRLVEATGFLDRPQFESEAKGFATDPDLRAWDEMILANEAAIRTEAGKTEFTGWVETKPGSTTEIVLRYQLPFEVKTNFLNRKAPYSLLFQKQPGFKHTQISGEWMFQSLKPEWASVNAKPEGNAVRFSSDGKTDQYWGALLTR